MRFVSLALFVFLGFGLLTARDAGAVNGIQLIGMSAQTEGMAGAGGSAGGFDTATIITNPAALTEVPREFKLGLILAFPHQTFDTSAAPLGNAAAGAMTSNDDPILLPSGSVVFPLMDGRLSIGMGAFAVAGFGVDLPASPLTPAITGNNFATHSQLYLLKVLGAGAYKINEKLSVGLATHVNIMSLSIDSPTAALTETAGGGRADTSFGLGVGVGVLYKPFEFLRIGVDYTSEQFFQKPERYADILPRGLNYPQQVGAGVVVVPPVSGLLIATDFRWINWSGATGGFGDPVAIGGLGWKDTYAAMIGVQYQPWDPVIFRTGYNHGTSAVDASNLFVNSLSPALGKNHLAFGMGLRVFKNVDLDMSYVWTISNRVTDRTANGLGTVISVGAQQGSLDMTVRF